MDEYGHYVDRTVHIQSPGIESDAPRCITMRLRLLHAAKMDEYGHCVDRTVHIKSPGIESDAPHCRTTHLTGYDTVCNDTLIG